MYLDSLLEVTDLTVEAIEENFNGFDDEDKHRAALILGHHKTEGVLCCEVEGCMIDGIEYLVYDDEEADTACAENIEESLWAFKPSFLAAQTGISVDVFTSLQRLYEEANVAIKKLIDTTCGMNVFVEEAIEAEYGRGHFLSGYDGEEREVCICGEYFFLYRI